MLKIRSLAALGIWTGFVFVGSASAQVAPSPMTCAVNVAATPTIRAEGFTEKVGEVTLSCTGGTPTALRTAVPAVNFQAFLNTGVTSRIYPNGLSEAMLIIDEPGSGIPGTSNTQLACNDPNGNCIVTGTGTGVGTFDGSQGRPNIFPGKVSANSVTFNGIPIDPPGRGQSRVFRFANIRANGTSISGTGATPTLAVLESISISGASSLLISNPTPTVAFVGPSLTTTLRSPDNSAAGSAAAVNSCLAPQRIGVLRFTEIFENAFASRSLAAFVNGDTSPAPVVQNIPGLIYSGESGFYNPALTAPTVDFATVGLADEGTRLKTVFSNIPAGARLWVSLRNTVFAGGNPSAASTGPVARLTSGEATKFAPPSASTTLEGVPALELPVAGGAATAIWEILANNPFLIENFDFVVWVQAGTVAGAATVNRSYAPTPPVPFTTVAASAASPTLPLPRFVADANPAIPLFNSSACQVPTTTGLTASPNNVVAGTPVTLTAKVDANIGTAAGSVNILDGNVPIATIPVLNGSASTVVTLAQGIHTLTAAFSNATGAFLASVSAPVVVTVNIAPAALVITTAAAGNGIVGTAYSASFAAGGGSPPFTWSASGLPGGLTMSAAGAISGTPAAPGTSNVTVTVRDSTGASTSKVFSIVIALPATPPLSFAGITATANPVQQPRLTVALGATFPVDVVVTLTLTFAPDTGGDDPSIVFSTGGRTARITVPAGSVSGSSDAGVQTGTVAGVITIVAQMQAAGLDVTPSPAPRQTIRINPAAPVMVTVSSTRPGTGFTVTINGYVTDREITQANFTFTAVAGSNVQPTLLTLAVDTLFTAYFGGTGATPFGSQFTYTQSFTVTGNPQAIATMTVTLVNKIGNSTAVTINLN